MHKNRKKKRKTNLDIGTTIHSTHFISVGKCNTVWRTTASAVRHYRGRSGDRKIWFSRFRLNKAWWLFHGRHCLGPLCSWWWWHWDELIRHVAVHKHHVSAVHHLITKRSWEISEWSRQITWNKKRIKKSISLESNCPLNEMCEKKKEKWEKTLLFIK